MPLRGDTKVQKKKTIVHFCEKTLNLQFFVLEYTQTWGDAKNFNIGRKLLAWRVRKISVYPVVSGALHSRAAQRWPVNITKTQNYLRLLNIHDIRLKKSEILSWGRVHINHDLSRSYEVIWGQTWVKIRSNHLSGQNIYI